MTNCFVISNQNQTFKKVVKGKMPQIELKVI